MWCESHNMHYFHINVRMCWCLIGILVHGQRSYVCTLPVYVLRIRISEFVETCEAHPETIYKQ